MILHITKAIYVEDYKVDVTFNNGRSGIVDLSPILRGGVFKPLEDQSFFAHLRVDDELETIVWPNEVDLAPEYVYFLTFRDDPDLQETFRTWGYLPRENEEFSPQIGSDEARKVANA